MDISFNFDKLLGKIKEVFKTQDAFADKMGISRTALNFKLNNKADFKAREIKKACRLLDILDTEIPAYFFALKVQKHEHNLPNPTSFAKGR